MRVKRFIADDMRTALREVREELGADAVILSNRKVNDQVEILAAMDYDEHLINHALGQSETGSQPAGGAADYFEKAAARRYIDQQTADNAARPTAVSSPAAQPAQAPRPASPFADPAHQAAGLFQSLANSDDSMSEMRDELKSLRAMLETQQTLSDWGSLSQRHPLRVSLYKRLTELGLSQDVCKYLAKGLDEASDIEQAMQAALKQLMHQLPVADDDILNQGGVYAMVGPTGVGKTTTIAKIAARFAMRHGNRHVALISTDNYRIGAHEQLLTYGRLLSVAVHTANNAQELQLLLNKLYDKKLILIDTAGMSQRDLRLSEQFVTMGSHASLIRSYLVLSANAQLATLDEVIRSFKKANLAGCVLTKTDEAVSLGGVLSAMIKHHLPAAYVSNGQRVPEDLQPARARELVAEALQLMKRRREKTDDDFMAVAFSGGVGHAHL
jgi:flagellar biosynthesis protein FlhF